MTTALAQLEQAERLLAERRLAELVDAGQAAGTVARRGNQPKGPDCGPLDLDELGVDKRRLAEARVLAKATPGRVRP